MKINFILYYAGLFLSLYNVYNICKCEPECTLKQKIKLKKKTPMKEYNTHVPMLNYWFLSVYCFINVCTHTTHVYLHTICIQKK